ncbi:superoxide dismutase [Cu-Zn]-like, partial [Symsagittifera roscoffensis]|uniref:superoxide dismutase [Cu-Zn]-like n=1 Tax=Symsagittifera roscoffensis TaxID=84072 RepID=UPI00307C078B
MKMKSLSVLLSFVHLCCGQYGYNPAPSPSPNPSPPPCSPRNDPSSDGVFSEYGMCVFQENLKGALFLRQGASGLEYRFKVRGMSQGLHGSHVHQYGSLFRSDSSQQICSESGSHHNPFGMSHGDFDDDIMNRHVGDLGNVCANGNG